MTLKKGSLPGPFCFFGGPVIRLWFRPNAGPPKKIMGTVKSLHLMRKRVKEGGRLGGRQSKNCQLQKCWVWPNKISEFVASLIVGRSLNICSGLSELGDIKIDSDPKNSLIQKGDMESLKFPDNSFDTVISDPPWKISFFKRQRPFSEAVRVCRPGGRIIYNCTWRPVSKQVKLEKVFLRSDNNWANVSAVWIFKKIKGN